MKIVNLEPCYVKAPNGNVAIATFSVEPIDGVRLYNLHLVQMPDSTLSIFLNGNKGNARTASMRTDVKAALAARVHEQLMSGW